MATKNLQYESGRSMVEMLGTLAIIGVLSIGGIAAYSYGMDKYRANTTMNDVNLRIVDLIAQANRGGDLSLSEWPTKSTVGYDIGLEKDATTSKNTGGIQVSSIPNRVCELLGEMTEVSNITLKIMGTDYTKGSCGEENVMVFFQSDVVNGIGGTQPCNGPVVDGACQPCEDGTWNETKEECLCPNGCPLDTPVSSSGAFDCVICPNGGISKGCECLGCPENYWFSDGSEIGGGYGDIYCYPCPEGSASAGGFATECICTTGKFTGCFGGYSSCDSNYTGCDW